MINGFAGDSELLDWIAIFGARYLIWIIVGFAIMAVVQLRKGELRIKFKRAFATGLAAAFGIVVNFIISFFVTRPRPYESGLGQNIYDGTMSMDSFPSEHTTAAFAIAMAVYFWNKKVGRVLLALAALVGLSRIFVGVHYPLDVVVGAIVGCTAAYVVVKLILRKI